MRSPAEEALRLAEDARILARRLKASEAEGGAALFTRDDVDRFITERLAREKRKTRQVEREQAELEREVEELR